MNKRKIIIITSLSVVGVATSYFVYTRVRNDKEIKFINKELEGSGGYGTIEDFAEVFEGSAYINKIKAKNPNLILLRNEPITDFRKQLYKAIKGIGTDSPVILNIFRTLKDKVQVAQIADSYQRNYNENLLEAIMGEVYFSPKSNNAKVLLNILKSKTNFRVSN